MTIDDIFAEYERKVAQVYLYQRESKDLADRELKQLGEYATKMKNVPAVKDFPAAVNSMYFYSARDGQIRLFASKSSSIQDRILEALLLKNKNYQLLLSQAYEAYEDFLQRAYAYVGHLDHGLWPLSDYGNIRLGELDSKNYAFYLDRAKSKKDSPRSILTAFRIIYPSFEQLESSNKLTKDLRVLIAFVEELRHVIIHAGGVVHDKKAFIEDVFSSVGRFNNGKYDQGQFDFMTAFFGDSGFEKTVSLVEIDAIPEMVGLPIRAQIDRFDLLVGYLMSSAHLLYEEIKGTEASASSQGKA